MNVSEITSERGVRSAGRALLRGRPPLMKECTERTSLGTELRDDNLH
jgi:hypothetical protein